MDAQHGRLDGFYKIADYYLRVFAECVPWKCLQLFLELFYILGPICWHVAFEGFYTIFLFFLAKDQFTVVNFVLLL